MNSTRHKHFDPRLHHAELTTILSHLYQLHLQNPQQKTQDNQQLQAILRQVPKNKQGYFSKSDLLAGYKFLSQTLSEMPYDPQFAAKLRLKPIRSLSGVLPITVLTKPFPCPGKCIFCPNDVRMPKSYLANEPGAQRAERNFFDPYLQTYNRLDALRQIGHSIDKAEVIVLGGTWSYYPEPYKIWFVKRCFEALNDFGEGIDQRSAIKPSIDTTNSIDPNSAIVREKSGLKVTYNQAVSQRYLQQELEKRQNNSEAAKWEELEFQHQRNQTSSVRCVGLVLETRPDCISEAEVIQLRRLGCTKTQIGLQSLQDSVLIANKRGHDVQASRRAMKLLRQAGLKIHAHWMPNLYGSSVTQDIKDFQQLWLDPDFHPDELKIYPCSLIDETELMNVYEAGQWHPYTHQELLEVLLAVYQATPAYCRLTRVIRDIPGTDIVVGNKITNFRQIVEQTLQHRGIPVQEIRSREIKGVDVKFSDLHLDTITYQTSVATEYFLQYVTKTNQIAGFLRLSIPVIPPYIPELTNSAIIREVHVYGQIVSVGKSKAGAAQHLGLGKRLIGHAEEIAVNNGKQQISVISAIGTREYYAKLGYQLAQLYQHKNLSVAAKSLRI